mmetsp:Transcript_64457/g.126560  ORF Transcript_64457/g.126560 Transcript_64457/m.126560 type:complete len:321 (+) Transcript_64457:50-1012(+)|eukprot:CAMPEP_0171616652 /NCGR_PEP_ID=MMETSP0990-20121206/13604_1 /TAXON_ID=483369 /ORGANISM="non described non described, Strain CCMP2098" /LENGTH=320 /DNA_ID=CAMNT_0012180957 /DNA_START=27 /DNA_END=989 /DNA_ORIENTATION=-
MASLTTAAEDENNSTHTQGKHSFHDLYDAPDACHYMREMHRVQYLIGDHSARIALKAIESLFSKPAEAEALPPVMLELCAGYGLSMAPIRTTRSCTEVIAHYVPERPELKVALAEDRAYFSSAAREGLPVLCSVGADVAGHALSYGKEVGLFDEFIARNLEEDPATEGNILTAEEGALCSRARLVLATGAFSYITTITLGKVIDFCDVKVGQEQVDGVQGNVPVFLFFPLVSTKVADIVAFFESRGLEVYYKPAVHWLPQRKFADDVEAGVVEASQSEVLAAHEAEGRPSGALDGHLHATPLIAGPKSLGLAKLCPGWLA